ncbi:hypothetical protein NSK_001338 [Nannochloropsis salina CCMP1776]|jgi:hypothetical protein|uniref:USP domain-containing protein n=1 Tax=Nannochloropsis salina CCMP1776 TaxID=1027361 RepID=A0A4D9D7K9_9STRA|nr:hypothetical protein NSK_001338 [Nannochloropsis salina CCMP1776]|eukprot:TFJ87004.1 hypothetical protein NSK_001338 [Nannochloropsis salina CCMP1776]
MAGGRQGKKCKICQRLSPAWHEETLVDLPPVLAFQLQRFVFAFDPVTASSNSKKVTARFSFPAVLDMWPYTREGKARCQLDPVVEEEGEGGGEGGREGGEDRPREWYRLAGVLMHRGASPQEGHYYSFVRREGGREGGGGWWCLNDELVSAFDPREEGERAWFAGGDDSPYMLLYEKEEAEAEGLVAEGEGRKGGVLKGPEGEGEALPKLHRRRLVSLAILVTGLTEATLADALPSFPPSARSCPSLFPDVQKLLSLFHWLASSSHRVREEGGEEEEDEGVHERLLHAIRHSERLLRHFLLSSSTASSGQDRAKNSLARWLASQLGGEGGWWGDIFHRRASPPSVAPSLSSTAVVYEHLENLWVGVTEAALDRLMDEPSTPGTRKVMEILARTVCGTEPGAHRTRLMRMEERLRPLLAGEGVGKEEERIGEGEDQSEEEDGGKVHRDEGRRRRHTAGAGQEGWVGSAEGPEGG